MPELPEVETVKRILDPELQGKKIVRVEVLRDLTIITDVPTFKKELIGQTFQKVTRAGKFLVFHLTSNIVLISHLRMEGKYFLEEETAPYRKQDLVIYHFDDGSKLTYNDVRKFGIIGMYHEDDYLTISPIKELGKEPFVLSIKELYEGLQRKKNEPIKEALLDQSLISGLGNIYDDEVLYSSKINPRTLARQVSPEECQTIIKESIRILSLAIENGGSTIKSYHPKEGISGRMQNSLEAYGRKGQPCSRCGFPLQKISIGGRGTTYCPLCQRRKGYPFVLAVSGPIHSGKSSVSSYFASKGYVLIDCDQIVKELYQEKQVKDVIVNQFGPSSLKEDGLIDKAYLAAQSSESREKKEALEGILHPLVYQRINDELLRLGEKKKVVLDIPLLFKGEFSSLVDFIIVVLSSKEQQKERLEKEGKDAETLLLLNKDWPIREAKAHAGALIINDGSLKELHEQLSKLDYLP